MSRDPGSVDPDFERPHHAVREVWSQAWPTVLTMTSYTVMGFVDAVMVAQVGPLEVAAQGNGGIWSFLPISLVFGVLTVVNTYVAQNVGAGRGRETAIYGWAGIWVAASAWMVLLLPWALLVPILFRFAGHESELVLLETEYARILLVGGLPLLVAKAMSHWFFGFQRPRVITVSAIAGNLVNVAINAILIFGENGIPAWGVPGVPGVPALGLRGAAIGTVLGTVVEAAIPLVLFLGRDLSARIGSRASWRPDRRAMREILGLGWPAAVQFGNEMACWTIFTTVLVGRFGTDHMTAGWSVMRYLHLSFMPAVGFSVATTSLVGRWIGAGRPEVAVARARVALMLAVGYMSTCAIGFLVFRDGLASVFVGGDIDAEQAARIVSIAGGMLVFAAIFQTMDAVGIVYTGALRGAGDTVWPGVATAVLSWSLLVGGGVVLIRLAPGLESRGPWIAATTYIVVYGIVMAIRFERGGWRSIRLLHDPASEAARHAPIGPAAPASDPAAVTRDLVEDLVEPTGDGGDERGA
jgi:MATE family multidrug resistance protein